MFQRRSVVLSAAAAIEGQARRRTLSEDDVALFFRLCHKHPFCRVRVYSGDGYVPNSYKGAAYITWVERTASGVLRIGRSGAHRAGGVGPQYTITGQAGAARKIAKRAAARAVNDDAALAASAA